MSEVYEKLESYAVECEEKTKAERIRLETETEGEHYAETEEETSYVDVLEADKVSLTRQGHQKNRAAFIHPLTCTAPTQEI